MDDPIGNFMAITQCSSEEVAIQFLSDANFDLGVAVGLYQSSRGASSAATTTRATTTTATNAKNNQRAAVTAVSDDDDEDAMLARALAASELEARGGGGGGSSASAGAKAAYNNNNNNNNNNKRGGLPLRDAEDDNSYEYDYGDYADDHQSAMTAADYNPTAQRVAAGLMDDPEAALRVGAGLGAGMGMGMGGRAGSLTLVEAARELNKNLLYIDQEVDYEPEFIDKYCGKIGSLRLPKWGCDKRYVYAGEDITTREASKFDLDVNPILTRFKYCCAIAEKQKKFVFLMVITGGVFNEMCCVRDLLSTRSSARGFLEENFLSFFQLVYGDSMRHVRTAQLAQLQLHQPEVKRMMHLNAFLSTYHLAQEPGENYMPFGRVPQCVLDSADPTSARRMYDTFCDGAFPVLAVINPQTHSVVKRIPVGQLFRMRGNVPELDSGTFMEELTSCLDTNFIGDNFFLQKEEGSFEATHSGGGHGNSAATATTTTTTTAATAAKEAQHSTAKTNINNHDNNNNNNTVNVDYEYDYDEGLEFAYGDDYTYDDGYHQHQPHHNDNAKEKDNANTHTIYNSRVVDGTTKPSSSSTAAASAATKSIVDVDESDTPSLPSAQQQQPSSGSGAPQGQTKQQQQQQQGGEYSGSSGGGGGGSGITHIIVDVTPYTRQQEGAGPAGGPSPPSSSPSSLSPADCFKLRIGTPKGQQTVELSKAMPLALFLPYLVVLCQPDKYCVGAGGSAAGGGAPLQFTLNEELALLTTQTRFLGGFPPKPLPIPVGTTDALRTVFEDTAMAIQESVERRLTKGGASSSSSLTISEWGAVRQNDSIRPSLP